MKKAKAPIAQGFWSGARINPQPPGMLPRFKHISNIFVKSTTPPKPPPRRKSDTNRKSKNLASTRNATIRESPATRKQTTPQNPPQSLPPIAKSANRGFSPNQKEPLRTSSAAPAKTKTPSPPAATSRTKAPPQSSPPPATRPETTPAIAPRRSKTRF